MRANGQLLFQVHQEVAKAIKPGVRLSAIDKLVETMIRDFGATPSFKGYNGFPYATCASLNDIVVHGFPDKTPMREGDIFSVDLGLKKDGYHSDSARTHLVGEVAEEVRLLVERTRKSFFQGLSKAREGNRIGDISHAVQEYAESFGYGVVRDLIGHGIGKNLHEDPNVPNFGKAGKGVRLRRGMTICIEPMINMGTERVYVEDDDWTVRTEDGKPSAHYEHTILITDGDPEILSAPPGQYAGDRL